MKLVFQRNFQALSRLIVICGKRGFEGEEFGVEIEK